MADEDREEKRISRILSGLKEFGRNKYYDRKAQSYLTDAQKFEYINEKQKQKAMLRAEEEAYKEKARREKEGEENIRRGRQGGSGLMGGVAAQQIRGVDKGTVWLFLALGVAVLDLFWGEPYRGFRFTILGIINTDFVGIISSTLFLALLLGDVFFSIFKFRHRSLFTLVAAYFVLHYIVQLKIYSLEINTIYINLFILLIGGFYAWKVSRREEPFNVISDEDKGYILLIFIVSYFWFQNGWQLQIKSWIHFVFILVFGIVFIRPHETEPGRWYYLTAFFLIIDFYGYSLAKDNGTLIFVFNILPPILVFVGSYLAVRTQNRATIPFTIFVIILLFLANPTKLSEDSGQALEKEKGKTPSEIAKELKNAVIQWAELRFEEGTGGYYKGRVEKNQYEKVGVYLDNIRASEPRYYTDEPVTIWGSLKSKTFSDVAIVNFNCYKWTSSRKKIRAGKIEPAEPFPIFNLEERDLECTFNPNILDDEQQKKEQRFSAGTHIVTLAANYNFATDSYMKSYFIDRDRYRAMIREELDPFDQYGIKEKKPVAVYTNGPVEIGMQLTPLIPVERINVARPLLSITLTNRGKILDAKGDVLGEYEGRIKNITELVILLPEGITIEQPATDCGDRVFKRYEGSDCLNSCTDNVQNTCTNLCNRMYEPKPEQNAETRSVSEVEKGLCLKECGNSKTLCDSDCAQLFSDDGTNYNGYALEVGNLEYRDELKDIDRFRTFGCRLFPTKEVLGNTPITTKFVRVRARYNYEMEKSVNVNVNLAPGLISQDVIGAIIESAGKVEAPVTPPEGAPAIPPAEIPHIEGVPVILPLAIALTESNFKHCCEESGENEYFNCEYDSATRCGPDKILTSYDGSSLGLMQINKINAGLASTECEEDQTIYDLGCNIKVGIRILKNGYSEEKREKSCPGYGEWEYSGWPRAVRSYIGWGCPGPVTSKCNKACREREFTYVERVYRNACGIINGAIDIENLPENLLDRLSPEERAKIKC